MSVFCDVVTGIWPGPPVPRVTISELAEKKERVDTPLIIKVSNFFFFVPVLIVYCHFNRPFHRLGSFFITEGRFM